MPSKKNAPLKNGKAASARGKASTGASLKQSVLRTVRRLPEDASLARILEEIHVMAAIQEAEEDIKAGRVTPHDEVEKQMESWISK